MTIQPLTIQNLVSNAQCYETVRVLRWPEGVRCPHCESSEVIKRGKGVGFAGIENALFFADNTRMVYGDAQKVAAGMIQGIKDLG